MTQLKKTSKGWVKRGIKESKKEIIDFGESIPSEELCSTLYKIMFNEREKEEYFKIFSLIIEGFSNKNGFDNEQGENIIDGLFKIALEKESDKEYDWLTKEIKNIKRLIFNNLMKFRMEDMGTFFNERANSYDNHMENNIDGFSEYYGSLALPMKESCDKKQILDLGIGTGLELKEIFTKIPQAEITGIDLSEEMMNVMMENYKNYDGQITTIKGSYLEEDMGENLYDYVISSMTIHHFDYKTKLKLYKKIRNSLKDGGIYIEGDFIVEKDRAEELLKSYHEIREFLDEDQLKLYHIDIPFSYETQIKLFQESGFSKIECIYRKANAAIIVGAKGISNYK